MRWGTGIATGRSYTSEGVTTANLSSRVLAYLITETDSALTQLPMVTHRSRDGETEPLRRLGVKFVTRCSARFVKTQPWSGQCPWGPAAGRAGEACLAPTRRNTIDVP
ncbi:MAG: hypothetical protein M3R02_22815 [Chloroflexota bacterium]|nr:hypothetical protein [Chloroflexota bacterium]